ncbi:MAG TPA: hypothetical protein VJT31_29360, partial [Rugosimonospora sp.]|nr:hypothetical protein [Rugosimonospora sp.]
IAGTRLRRLFPGPSVPLRPTALGNALAAMEHRAGAEYGWDAVVAWPRLYLVLGQPTRMVVDDRRDTLDTAARLAVTAGITAIASAALLARSGWWLLLALAPLGVAALAYQGAVLAAVAYGDAVRAAFDLHRFDLLDKLHLPLPADQTAERTACDALSLLWRQGAGQPLRYRHPDAAAVTGGETPAG